MVIAVLNQKGGTGKTTTAVNLAAALAENLPDPVLLLDMDSQADTMSFEGGAQNVVWGAATPKNLGKYLRDRSPAMWTVIDCPPAFGTEIAAALKIADVALVPVDSRYASLRGLDRLNTTISAAQNSGNLTLRRRVVLTLHNPNNVKHQEIATVVQRTFGAELLKTTIRLSPIFEDASRAHESVIVYSPRSKGAACYRALALELQQQTIAQETPSS